jgi:hypothetical protein
MATQKGYATLIEDAIAAVLKALTDADGDALFKTAEVYKNQFQERSLVESLDALAPCAFVKHTPGAPQREGGHDLSRVLDFEIVYGCTSVTAGDARRGTDDKIGGSKLYDTIVAALEGWHPGAEFDCDEFHLTDETEVLDAPKKYIGGLIFSARRNS